MDLERPCDRINGDFVADVEGARSNNLIRSQHILVNIQILAINIV